MTASPIQTAIDLISISVRTAPKSGGIDDISFFVLNNQQKKQLVRGMIDIGKKNARSAPNKTVAQALETSWTTDAKAVEKSQAVVVIGVAGKKPIGFNCGGCGYATCAEFAKAAQKLKNTALNGPFCIFKIYDLGIAVASAAKTAAALDVDNRIMYRVGAVVSRLNLAERHATPLLGLPLSVSGKNIFFDRLDKLQAAAVLKGYYSRRK